VPFDDEVNNRSIDDELNNHSIDDEVNNRSIDLGENTLTGTLKKIGNKIVFCTIATASAGATCYVIGKSIGVLGGRTRNKKRRNKKTRKAK
jgi:hypothetical protein